MNSNGVTIVGEVKNMFDLATTHSGKPVISFGVLVKDDLGRAGHEHVDVFCAGELAEHVDNSVRVGDRVIVTGALRVRENAGRNRTFVDVRAYDVGLALRYGDVTVEREFATATEEA
jgi:single-stranded DNA-binding protein